VDVPNEAQYVALVPWKFHFNGSRAAQGAGVGIVLESPQGVKTQLAFRVEKVCSNNQVEYEALVLGLKILLQMGIKKVTIFGDSQLVINQVKGQYKFGSVLLAPWSMGLSKPILNGMSYYSKYYGPIEPPKG
jgi:ribonuclease HI